MPNSQSMVREIRVLVRGEAGQGVMDVFVFSECPDFPPAHGWRTAQVPKAVSLVDWLATNIGNYLYWSPGSPDADTTQK